MARTFTGAQKVELFAALAAPLLGLAGAAQLFLMDVYTSQSCSADQGGGLACTTTSETLVEHGIPNGAWVFLGLVAALILLVPIAAAADVLHGYRGARLALRIVALTLLLGAFVTGFSIGMFILPAALAAGVSAVATLSGRRERPAYT